MSAIVSFMSRGTMAEKSASPTALPEPFDDGFVSPGNALRPGIIRPPAVAVAGGVAVLDGALDEALARRVYAHTVGRAEPWGTYVTVRRGDGAEMLLEATGGSSAAGLADDALGTEVIASFLRGPGGAALAEAMAHVHGFELWAVRGPEGHEVRYHLDYAEWHRKRTNVVCPPLLAITVQVSPIGEGAPMDGGEYGANSGGLAHYARFGFKSVRVPVPDGLPVADWEEAGSGWVKVPYRFNRAVVHPGEWPHLATRVRALPPGVQRVVVGINPFCGRVGPLERAAPQHSEAFRRQLRLDGLRALIQGQGADGRVELGALGPEAKRMLVAILRKKRAVDGAASSSAEPPPAPPDDDGGTDGAQPAPSSSAPAVE